MFFPTQIENEQQLDNLLCAPSDAAVEALCEHTGDVLLLGAGGKMGGTLAGMFRRAAEKADAGKSSRRIIAVSRFRDPSRVDWLQQQGVEVLRGSLLDEAFVRQLPEAPIVVGMTGYKFGTGADPTPTWATNVWLPSLYCRRFPESRLVVYSTGNVYPLVGPSSGGSKESDILAPVGEYAMSALARERMVAYHRTELAAPTVLLRLNYAVELRYGVLLDIALRVFRGEPVDLGMGYVNVLWQGDACAMTIAAISLAACPPAVVNLAGPECLSVRELATSFGEHFGKTPNFVGTEGEVALLSNGEKSYTLWGPPRVSASQVIPWVAQWVASGGRQLGKPTHFQVTDGAF